MNMVLNRPLRPGKRESCLHSVIVFFERLCKAAQFGHALLFDLFQPCIKTFPFPLTQHGRKFLDEFVGLADLLIRFAKLAEVLHLPLRALLFLKGNPMSDLGSGWGTFGWWGHSASSEVVVFTAVIVVSEASRSFKCKQVGSGNSVGFAIASGSFYHIFFGREASIPTRDSNDKKGPQMAYC